METVNSGGDHQQGGVENAMNRPAWIRRHLAGSIYLWACGEKTDDDEDDPKSSDKLIGWLILLVQGFAYAMLFVLSRKTLDFGADSPSNAGDSSYAGAFSSSTDDRHGTTFYGGSAYSRTSLDSDGGSTLSDSSATNNDDSKYFESGYDDHSGGYFRSGDHDDSDSTLGSGASYDDDAFFESGYNDDTGYTDDSGYTYAGNGGTYGDYYTGYYVGSRSTSNQDGDYYYAGRRFTDGTSSSSFVPYADYGYNDLGTGATDDSAGQEESPYVLPAMTGAMYLLIASTAHDFRAGFSLLVDGTCAGHRTFGVGLLIVHGVMITAAISVLLSTSQDSASVVLNAVTVIFIADLDEKALKFLSTVPHKWRLFWAIHTIGISFVLASLAVVSIGDGNGDYALKLSSTRSNLEGFPSWILWVLTPLCLTILAYGMSICINHICMSSNMSLETVQQQAWSCVVLRAVFTRLLSTIKRAIEYVQKDCYFYGALTVWVAQAFLWPLLITLGFPFAVCVYVNYNIDTGENSGISFEVGNTWFLVIQSACLVAGLAMKVMGILLPRHRNVIGPPEPRPSSDAHGALLERRVSRFDHRLSSFLIGWGLGYWFTSLLFVLMVTWDILGWYNLPTVVQLFTSFFSPCLVVTSIFIISDINFLGAQVGAFIKPAVEIVQDRRGFVFWMMATVFRDALVLWLDIVYLVLFGLW